MEGRSVGSGQVGGKSQSTCDGGISFANDGKNVQIVVSMHTRDPTRGFSRTKK